MKSKIVTFNHGMKKIVILLILLIAVFAMYVGNSPEDSRTEDDIEEVIAPQKNVDKKIVGKNVNVSQIPENEIEPPLSRNLRARLPDFQIVFSNLSAWNGALSAEDFQVIRNLKQKMDNKKFFDVNDVAGINHLDDRNIINAIKQNNPSLLNQMITQDEPVYNSSEDYNNEYVPEPEPPHQEQQEHQEIQEAQPEIENNNYENNN